MAHSLLLQFLSEMIHFLEAAEVGPGPILAAVLALFVAAFGTSVLFVGAAGFVARAVLPPPSFNTAYLFMNLALFFLGLLLMFLSVSVSRSAMPRSPRRRSIAVADSLLSRALNVSLAAVFLSASVIIRLMDAER